MRIQVSTQLNSYSYRMNCNWNWNWPRLNQMHIHICIHIHIHSSFIQPHSSAIKNLGTNSKINSQSQDLYHLLCVGDCLFLFLFLLLPLHTLATFILLHFPVYHDFDMFMWLFLVALLQCIHSSLARLLSSKELREEQYVRIVKKIGLGEGGECKKRGNGVEWRQQHSHR